MHDITRRVVLPGIFVEGLIELADQLFEDRPHRGVVDFVGMEIDILEFLEYLEEEAGFIELADRVVEIEFLDHLPHIGAEARDVVAEIFGQIRGIGK